MKALIVAILLTVALAGGSYYHGRQLTLTRGNWHSFNFACGNEDSYGKWNINWNDHYNYRASGYPSWLSWSGSRLSGNVPRDWSGQFWLDLSWTGRSSGSNRYWFSSDDYKTSSSNWGDVWWWNGDSSNDWTVAAPAYRWTTTTITTTPVVVSEPVVVPQPIVVSRPVVVSGPAVISAPAAVSTVSYSDDSHSSGGWGDGESHGEGHGRGNGWGKGWEKGKGNGRGNGKGRGGNGWGWGSGSYSCGTVNWRGSGRVTGVGSGYCAIDGKRVRFADCSSRRYRKGRSSFAVSDLVDYEGWDDGTTIWAKRIDCRD